MRSSIYHRGRSANAEGGFTLLELIVAANILSILTMMALPLARVAIQREKEKQLRLALWEMRDAIDNYKMAGESASVKSIYSRENSWDRETFSPFAINSKLRIGTFLFPRSTSARKLRSIPTRSPSRPALDSSPRHYRRVMQMESN